MGDQARGQLALDIFNELWPTGTPITESPTNIGFPRNNIFLDIRELSLVSRRAVDAAYYLVAQNPEIGTHDYDQSFFRWLMNYESTNTTHLRKALRQAQKAALEVSIIDPEHPQKDKWVSVPLLGPVALSGGRIVFEVHELMRKQIKDPSTNKSFLSLRVKGRFNSLHAALLYDQLNAIVDECVSDDGYTDWYDLELIRNWFEVNDSKMAAEFKYLRREILDPSVLAINTVSDLVVSYEKRAAPGSKRITKLRFKVERRTDGANATIIPGLRSPELYTILRDEFGLSASEFDLLGENKNEWTDDRILEAIEYTRDRLEKGVVKYPNAFLMNSIKEGKKISDAERKIEAQKKKANQSQEDMEESKRVMAEEKKDKEKTAQVEVSKKVIQALKFFDTLSIQDRTEMVKEFMRNPAGRVAAVRAKINVDEVNEQIIRGNEILSKALGGFLSGKGR